MDRADEIAEETIKSIRSLNWIEPDNWEAQGKAWIAAAIRSFRVECIEEARQAIDVPGVNLNPYREREQSIERIEALKTKSETGEGDRK